jgi:hypothetical protein
VGGAAITLGQKTSAASIPVTIASDQTAVPVSQSGTWNITNISGTVSLPTGASTSALQTTGNTSLASILANQTNGTQVTQLAAGTALIGTVSINQTTPGTTNGVVLNAGANNVGSITNITGTISLPTGASTSALQTTGNTSLATIATNTTGISTAANQTAVIGSSTGGTAATSSELSGGVFNTTLPTLTNGQQAATQVDNHGRILSIPSTPNALTVTNAAITVGTTAVRLTVSGSAPAATRVALVATPDVASTATFYIGTSTVTNSGATRGVEIVAGQSFIANNDAGDYWIVSSTASQTVTVMEQA